MNINFKNPDFQEEVDTWNKVYGLERRYKAYYCSEMYSYFEHQYIAFMNMGISHEQYIGIISKIKYKECNFLKIPFLEFVDLLKDETTPK